VRFGLGDQCVCFLREVIGVSEENLFEALAVLSGERNDTRRREAGLAPRAT
jgi:hypothetical protein